MFCTNCGTELAIETKFCPECETKVEAGCEAAIDYLNEIQSKNNTKETLKAVGSGIASFLGGVIGGIADTLLSGSGNGDDDYDDDDE